MSAILHTTGTQSAEELFNIEGHAFPLSGSDPFHRNRRHRSEDSIRNLFILDPRSQLLVREFVKQPNHHGAIPDRLKVRYRLGDGLRLTATRNMLTRIACLIVEYLLPKSLQVIRINLSHRFSRIASE